MKKLTKISLMTMTALLLVFAIAGIASASIEISTYDPATLLPKGDFAPEETVLIQGSGFSIASNVDVKITRPDGTMVKGDGTFTEGFDTVTTDLNGNLNYEYILDGIEGTYQVECIDTDTQVLLTAFTFTDSRYKLNGWDNHNHGWTPGELDSYTEGDMVQFKLKITVTNHDLRNGDFSSSFDVWHNNTLGGTVGFDSAEDFYVGDDAGNPVSSAHWASNGNDAANGDIQYHGTFTASHSGVYYLYWKAHLAEGSCNWPNENIHSGVHAPGNHTIPCKKPCAHPNPKPSITAIDPTSGPVGTAVMITGSNFGAIQGGSTVTFSGTTATVTSWSSTSILVAVPAGATDGNVVVTTCSGASNGVPFDVTVPIPVPNITGIDPTSGPVGTTVTISGTGFGGGSGGSVTFNGTTATVTSWTDTSIVVTVPDGATDGDVVVTTDGGDSNGVAFDVTVPIPVPNITGIDPTSGLVGTTVTITGTGFGGGSGGSVTFNGTTATITSWSDTSIVVIVPEGATSGDVIVTTDGGSSNGVAFEVLTPAPEIDSIDPTSGIAGTTVTIDGANFGDTQDTSVVTINGVEATVTSWSDTQIVVTVPPDATDGDVVVTVGGTSSNGVAFDVIEAPVINSIDPSAGPIGTSVTIDGSNFGATQGSSTVSFNGANAAVTSWADTQIVATVPAGATTGNVFVTVNSQASNGVLFTLTSGPLRHETNYAVWGRLLRDTSWDDYGGSGYSGSSSLASKWTNDVCTFTFTGTQINVMMLTGPNRGKANVYIDNGPAQVIDAYAPTYTFQNVGFTQTFLTESTHTIKIVVSGTKNASSSDFWVDVDAFDVVQGGVTKRYESQIGRWSGSWGVYTHASYSNGSSMATKETGAYCTYTFTGSKIDWISLKGLNRGYAKVYIDNTLDANVDCYSPTYDFQAITYSKTFTATGTHTIKIVVDGLNKNGSSVDYWVDVDAFDIWP